MQSSATHLRGQEWASGQGGARTALGWDCQPAASCSSWRRTALWQEACWGRCRRPGTRERDRGVGLAWGQRDGEEGPVASQRSPASLGPKRQWNGCEEIRGQGGRRKRTTPPTPHPRCSGLCCFPERWRGGNHSPRVLGKNLAVREGRPGET